MNKIERYRRNVKYVLNDYGHMAGAAIKTYREYAKKSAWCDQSNTPFVK
jgi:hypothetical protein